MDAVILAAGRNQRLKGLVAPYHKPLLVINGKPLIVSNFLSVCKLSSFVTIVTAPENTMPICNILSQYPEFNNAQVVVQPEARGPGEALFRALKCRVSDQTMIICADNLIPQEDVDMVAFSSTTVPEDIIIGGRKIKDKNEASRFTRLDIKKNRLIEGEEGGEFLGEYNCWLGPMVVPTTATYNLLRNVIQNQSKSASSDEIKISKNLNGLNRKYRFIEVNCLDIGVPEALS
jgi:NDP-sugar pyrophosphorylase family protein